MDPLVLGRVEPLARLDRFVEDVAAGPAALVVEGEPGIGKTTVWRWAVEAAATRGYRVLTSRPSEAESRLGYSGLADLLTPVDSSHTEALPGPLRHALEVALLVSEPAGRPPQPRAIFAALGGDPAIARRRFPGCSSPSTTGSGWTRARDMRSTMRHVASTGAPVGVLATRRPGVSDSAAVETIRLRGLSPAALYRLVEGRLGVSLPRSTVMRLHRTTDGNPFYALEIASALIAAELPGASDPWPIPDDLRDIVAIRVRKLPKSSRAALLVAAASSRARLDARAPSLRPAERAGIVRIDAEGSVRFAHPLYSAAIYDGATEEERRRAHALLADADNDLEEQARHRALATSGADEQVAALLERAASRAQARGATDVAAELGERAVLLTPSDMLDNDRRRRVAAAEYNFRAGDLERARTQLAELVRRTEAPPDSHTLRLLAEVCYRLHHLDEAMPAPPRGDRGGRRRARGDGTCRAGPRIHAGLLVQELPGGGRCCSASSRCSRADR